MAIVDTIHAALPLLWLACWVPLVALIHEVGHAVCARPAGYRVSSFGVGRGRPLLRVKSPSGTVFWVGALFFAGGACVAVPARPPGGPRSALFHAGGVIAQLVLAVVLMALPDWWWVGPILHFNTLVAVWNLVPWRFGAMASDGWWLLRWFAGSGASAAPLFAQREPITGMVAFETRVGAPLGQTSGQLMLGWLDLLTGHDPDGVCLPDVVVDSPELVGLRTVLEADRHRRAGRPARALHDLLKVSLPNLELEDQAALVKARAWLALGDTVRARRVASQLAGVEGAHGDEAQTLALDIALKEGDLAEIEATGSRLSARLSGPLRWRRLDPVAAVLALYAAGEALEDHAAWRDQASWLAESLVGAAVHADWVPLEAALAPCFMSGSGLPALESASRE